ncbi:PEP-CTERM sorting domain-containing protein [uncultured Azohydromonas sp.]|uniref:PEP-CTERM sorting domain-containing protein n=1 Tax=uncultured Azohydromonas sp. TaxID=487342 RepID=UPI002637F745|nr:PEP-CTERM sorting domain-containing protein [uncultured Azohydromonas sp.]
MKKVLAVAVLAASAVGSAMAAPLMGSVLNYQYYYPDSGTSYAGTPDVNSNFIVGPDAEFYTLTDAIGSMDVTADQVIVDFSHSGTFGPATFNGWVLTDIFSNIDRFASVTIDAATNMVGLDASRLSFTDDTIALNWQGLAFDADTRVVLNVSTSPFPVPEPGSLPLLGAALLGIAFIRRNA